MTTSPHGTPMPQFDSGVTMLAVSSPATRRRYMKALGIAASQVTWAGFGRPSGTHSVAPKLGAIMPTGQGRQLVAPGLAAYVLGAQGTGWSLPPGQKEPRGQGSLAASSSDRAPGTHTFPGGHA